MERYISLTLRYGVIVCGLILATGVGLLLMAPGNGSLLEAVRTGDQATLGELAPKTLAGFAHGLAIHDPNVVISLGLVLLVALPIVRVLLTVFIFLKEKDHVYVALTTFVFVVLITGIVLGRAV